MSDAFVVDASATLKILVEEAGSEHARLFFGRLASANPLLIHVPDLLYIECANIVTTYFRKHSP